MKHLDPKAIWLFTLQTLMGFIFLIVILGFFIIPAMLGIGAFLVEGGISPGAGAGIMAAVIIGLFLVAFLISYGWARLVYSNYKYELNEHGFKKEEGVIFKKYVTIPYERIQNVDIYRGIWARILGLSDLHIQTAGMSAPMGHYGMMGTEGRIIAISKMEAESLRDELIKRARGKGGGV